MGLRSRKAAERRRRCYGTACLTCWAPVLRRLSGRAELRGLVLLGLAEDGRDVEVDAGLLPGLGLARVAGGEVDDRPVGQRHGDLGDPGAAAGRAGRELADGRG